MLSVREDDIYLLVRVQVDETQSRIAPLLVDNPGSWWQLERQFPKMRGVGGPSKNCLAVRVAYQHFTATILIQVTQPYTGIQSIGHRLNPLIATQPPPSHARREPIVGRQNAINPQ